MAQPVVHLWRESGEHQEWQPTTLSDLGKDEKFLEQIIADSPELLGLRGSGIKGPFKAFRQLSLETPQGRSIRPDIVFLTASGHAVVVEVKLHSNPDLGKRDVIAQIVDYASS